LELEWSLGRVDGVVLVNGRDLASMCVLRPRLQEQVSLNFGGAEKWRRRQIRLRVSYNIQTGKSTEVELRFIYADGWSNTERVKA
jgi:hypothetical protein